MLAWLAARHPATHEASCIQQFLAYWHPAAPERFTDFEYYLQHTAQLSKEWSSPLVEADAINDPDESTLYVLPEDLFRWPSTRYSREILGKCAGSPSTYPRREDLSCVRPRRGCAIPDICARHAEDAQQAE